MSEKTNLSLSTIQTYRKRGVLPEADAVLDNKPLWKAETIEAWLRERAGVEVAAPYEHGSLTEDKPGV